MLNPLNKPMLDGVCFTTDLDWASEYAVKKILDFFFDNGICPTVFLTHESKCAFQYAEERKIELGIHPNFVQPSSQGKDVDEVIHYCMNLLPEAKVFRCHRWFASNDAYDALFQRGLRYDSNLCTMLDIISPFRHRSGIISFPAFFEDGAWLYHGENLCFDDNKNLFAQKGLKIINVHPMHFVINTPCFRYMRDIKDRLPRADWNNLSEDVIMAMSNSEQLGIGDFVKDMVGYFQKEKMNQYTLKQAYDIFVAHNK